MDDTTEDDQKNSSSCSDYKPLGHDQKMESTLDPDFWFIKLVQFIRPHQMGWGSLIKILVVDKATLLKKSTS